MLFAFWNEQWENLSFFFVDPLPLRPMGGLSEAPVFKNAVGLKAVSETHYHNVLGLAFFLSNDKTCPLRKSSLKGLKGSCSSKKKKKRQHLGRTEIMWDILCVRISVHICGCIRSKPHIFSCVFYVEKTGLSGINICPSEALCKSVKLSVCTENWMIYRLIHQNIFKLCHFVALCILHSGTLSDKRK